MPQIEAIQERARSIRRLATPAQICAMSLPAAYLSQNLTQPRGSRPLYVGAASRSRRTVPTLAAGLILDQADVAAVSHQVHLALFYDAQLDIKAMPQLKSHRVFAQTLFANAMDARVKPAHDKRGTPTRSANSHIAGSRRPRRQGQPGPDQADTRRLGRVLDETQHSNRVREVLGLACARPNLRLQTGGLVLAPPRLG